MSTIDVNACAADPKPEDVILDQDIDALRDLKRAHAFVIDARRSLGEAEREVTFQKERLATAEQMVAKRTAELADLLCEFL